MLTSETLQPIQLIEDLFAGHISLERHGESVKPWRIPYHQADLYPPDAVNGKAEIPAGIRLRFRSESQNVSISASLSDPGGRFDCLVDGIRVASIPAGTGDAQILFGDLPAGDKLVEIYLPQSCPVTLHSLKIDPDAGVRPVSEGGPRWVTYGSSITQCASADGPSQTWPALVAQALGFDLTCLGFGGNCHLEPMLARLIRDLPADLISLCLGINVYGASSLGPRTFKASVIGLIQVIREKHSTTPIAVISPIASPPRERVENAVGFTLEGMRAEVQDAVARLQGLGDTRLIYVDGLRIMDVDDAEAHMPDQLHPDAEGYRLMAERIQQHVFGHPLFADIKRSA